MIINNGKYCVYVHTNKINGKMYVGQTCQKPERRWNKGGGYRPETYFGKAIAKYGWDNFEHEIVASNLTKEEADNFEILLIKELNTQNRSYGYNLTAGGEGSSGCVRNEEWRAKQSEAHKGKKHSEESKLLIAQHSPRRKGRVGQYDKQWNLIREWDWAEQAAKELKTRHITDVLRGERKSAAGFYWKYLEDDKQCQQ